MTTPHLPLLLALVTSLALAGCADNEEASPESPYVDQLHSPVRGLSQAEIDELLAGGGAGYARAAELNGYPGPRHVLDLAEELNLSTQQVATFQSLFDEMQAQARQAGATVVEAHKALEDAFRDETITSEGLTGLTAAVDGAINKYRTIHLEYHLESKPLLTQHQNLRYQTLRGYDDGGHEHIGH